MRIVESLHMVETIEDWSKVRSPSRAVRRRKQGHRQNIVVRHVPRKDAISIDGGRTFMVHPEAMKALRDATPTQWKGGFSNLAPFGQPIGRGR